MFTQPLNTLVLMRIGGFRLAHGRADDTFAWLLIGLAILGVAIWALSRLSEKPASRSLE